MFGEQNREMKTVDLKELRHLECLRVSDNETDHINDLADDQLQRLETDLLGKEEHLTQEQMERELEDEIPF